MVNSTANNSQTSGRKRSSSSALSPRLNQKNKFLPLQELEDTNIDNNESENDEENKNQEVRQKIPPLFIYDVTDYIAFLVSISSMIIDNFDIDNKH